MKGIQPTLSACQERGKNGERRPLELTIVELTKGEKKSSGFG
jgi:hypothetical protein